MISLETWVTPDVDVGKIEHFRHPDFVIGIKYIPVLYKAPVTKYFDPEKLIEFNNIR